MTFLFDQIRCFVAVAEELHFGRAAEHLQMTQPPLSPQIQKLERAVGVRLLERDNRKVELPSAGQAFLVEPPRSTSTRSRRTCSGQNQGVVDRAGVLGPSSTIRPGARQILPDVAGGTWLTVWAVFSPVTETTRTTRS
jgi:hypothetical protein